MLYDIARERSYQTPLSNSSLLPLMLMSLATQKNAPTNTQTVSTIYQEYDYIIVGSGSAGSTLANRLSEASCASILVLEAGGQAPLLSDLAPLQASFFDTDLDWNYTTVPQKHIGGRKIPWKCGRGWGGTSLINCNLFVRGYPERFDKWDRMGAKGWSYLDVLPYFKKIEDYMNPMFANDGHHGFGGPISVEVPNYHPPLQQGLLQAAKDLGHDIVDINGPSKTGYWIPEGTLRNQQRCSTAKAYLVPAEDRPNLHLLPHAFVHKVMIDNGRATGVSFEVDGTKHVVKAKKEVIVSAGTVNTAKILQLSGIGPKSLLDKHSIPVVADLPVGRHVHDGFAAALEFVLGPQVKTPEEQLNNDDNIKDYIEHRHGIVK